MSQVDFQTSTVCRARKTLAIPQEPFQPLQLLEHLLRHGGVVAGAQALGQPLHDGDAPRIVESVQVLFGLRIQVGRQVAYVFPALATPCKPFVTGVLSSGSGDSLM